MQQIKRLNVLSVAKMAGIAYGAISLLFVPFILIFGVAGAFANARGGAGLSAAAAVVIGVIMAIILPAIYGLVGFLMGALMAFVYNVVAERFGGIEFELSPPPQAALAAQPSPASMM